MKTPHAKVIVNPAAGGHSVRRDWPHIRKRMESIGLSFDHEHCRHAGHAAEIARKAVDAGCRYLIAVGGDGTINEVVNGIMRSTAPDKTMLGIISMGTACSFIRSIGIPEDYNSACSLLTGEGRRLVDVGMVEYSNEDRREKRFFINEADAGFGAEVVETAKDLPTNLGRSVNYAPYAIASIKCLFNYQNKRFSLRIDDGAVTTSINTMIVIANGRYYGGGMHIAPGATLDDGLLDLVIFGDLEKSEMGKVWLMSYEGTHINHEAVTVIKARNITIESQDRVLVETDGELIGSCPASFHVIPSALTVVV